MSARPFKLKPPKVPEATRQRGIAQTLTLEFAPAGKLSRHGVCWYSIDMAAYSGVAPGLRTARGCVAGVPDVFLLFRGQSHFIEIKTEDGVLSDPQREVIAALFAAGGRCGVARDADEVLAIIDQWRIPRAHRVRIAA